MSTFKAYGNVDNIARHTFPMNRALYIDELVKRIASNIENGSKGSASLLALACCCKALEGPVMDLLWQRQKFLHIILQTLPADCWTITDGEYVSFLYSDLFRVAHSPFFSVLVDTPRRES